MEVSTQVGVRVSARQSALPMTINPGKEIDKLSSSSSSCNIDSTGEGENVYVGRFVPTYVHG